MSRELIEESKSRVIGVDELRELLALLRVELLALWNCISC